MSSSNSPQPWDQVTPLFKINLQQLPKMPIAMEDMFGGLINNQIIYSCGFGGNIKKGAFRTFTKQTISIPLKSILEPQTKKETINHTTSPDFPGNPRQKGTSITINNELLCWGGYSYTPMKTLTPKVLASKKKDPKSFIDGYAYSPETQSWRKLPDLPAHISSFSLTQIANDIYLFGGCDYHDSSYNTWHDRNGENEFFGSRLYKISISDIFPTTNPNATWTRLPDCPGTPRMNHISEAVNNKIYVIGGAAGRPFGGKFYSTVDNWSFDTTTNKWTRLIDTPTSNTNWQNSVVYKEKYIILVGGSITTNKGSSVNNRLVINRNKEESQPYGDQRRNKVKNFKNIMSGEILVYDTSTNKFHRIDGVNNPIPLPVNVNNPLVFLNDDNLIIVGGEIEISESMRRKLPTKLHCYSSDLIFAGKILPSSI
tara:strand:- start:355 stop:1632 length:1278 start_codon:yes stop_codon:yes gene_type:complete